MTAPARVAAILACWTGGRVGAREAEPTTRHVFPVWPRHGTAPAALGADDDRPKVVNAVRKERPDLAVHVGGDADFGLPAVYQARGANGLTHTFGLPIRQQGRGLIGTVKGLFQRHLSGQPCDLFTPAAQ